MKVTLKNVKINLSFSEETIMFKADLYINGKKVGYCENGGKGGSTHYSHYDENGRKVIKECEDYFKTLPNVVYDFGDIPQSLDGAIDDIIDNMVNEKEKLKFEKKMQKDMLTKLVLSTGNPNSYKVIGWKNGLTIEKILSTEKGRIAIKDTVKKFKKEGYTILNTNIPKEILESV
jgi:hypothetical protein